MRVLARMPTVGAGSRGVGGAAQSTLAKPPSVSAALKARIRASESAYAAACVSTRAAGHTCAHESQKPALSRSQPRLAPWSVARHSRSPRRLRLCEGARAGVAAARLGKVCVRAGRERDSLESAHPNHARLPNTGWDRSGERMRSMVLCCDVPYTVLQCAILRVPSGPAAGSGDCEFWLAEVRVWSACAPAHAQAGFGPT